MTPDIAAVTVRRCNLVTRDPLRPHTRRVATPTRGFRRRWQAMRPQSSFGLRWPEDVVCEFPGVRSVWNLD
jgi:hypothetical protein